MNPLFHKQDLTHFHLKSRSLELELLANIHSNKSILIETDTILQLIIGLIVGTFFGYFIYNIANKYIVGNIKMKKDDYFYK